MSADIMDGLKGKIKVSLVQLSIIYQQDGAVAILSNIF